jgi:hypothetical protein
MPPQLRPTAVTHLGVFYPRGYLILAFRDPADAAKVRESLMEGGYEADDVQIVPPDIVVDQVSQMAQEQGLAARMLGSEQEALEKQRQMAEQRATFLLVYAPSDLDTERAMKVARRHDVELAHKYDRFSIRSM